MSIKIDPRYKLNKQKKIKATITTRIDVDIYQEIIKRGIKINDVLDFGARYILAEQDEIAGQDNGNAFPKSIYLDKLEQRIKNWQDEANRLKGGA